MPTNFLANLGSGLRNFGAFISPEFEAGASLGAGLKKRFRRPGEREDDMDQPSSMPSFDSGASSKIPNVGEILEDPITDAENDARRNLPINPRPTPIPRLPSRDDLPDLPIKRGDITMPPLSPAPSLSGLRMATPGPPVLSPRASLPIRVPPPPAPGAMPAPAFEPEPIRDYRGREIGDRVGFERDQYVRKGMKSPEEGGGFKRSLRMTLQNAMLGASAALSRGGGIEEALGGTIAGAGGSLINPQAGYEFGFEHGVRPKIEAEMERERRNRERANLEIFNQAKLDDLRATTDERRAQAKKLGEPAPRPVNRSIGVNRKTGRREFFDATDPSQLALYDPDPLKSTARRLGRNIETGDVEYYDPGNPDQAAAFEPYRMPTPESGKTSKPPLRQMSADRAKLDNANQTAQRLWKTWGETPEGLEKEKARERAGAAQDAYNQAVGRFGELYGEWYETGQGSGGWGYVKKRQGGGEAPPQGSLRQASGRKPVVGQDFVNHVANTLKITPEEARRRIRADGYAIK